MDRELMADTKRIDSRDYIFLHYRNSTQFTVDTIAYRSMFLRRVWLWSIINLMSALIIPVAFGVSYVTLSKGTVADKWMLISGCLIVYISFALGRGPLPPFSRLPRWFQRYWLRNLPCGADLFRDYMLANFRE